MGDISIDCWDFCPLCNTRLVQLSSTEKHFLCPNSGCGRCFHISDKDTFTIVPNNGFTCMRCLE